MANQKADPAQTLKILYKKYPDAHCALVFRNEFELLVATILSAQCTDERVNKVTPNLFKAFPDSKRMADAPISQVEELIRSTGFYHNKAKNIVNCAKDLVLKYDGQVPRTMAELSELPGVGRKTANVVLGNSFNIAEGVVVDTHVGRLAVRLGWTRAKDPVKAEKVLMKIFESRDWIMLPHLLISHGRGPCRARNPMCQECFLFDACPRRGVK